MLQYASYFRTLYDQPSPVGALGRGAHYSILQVMVWHDHAMQPVPRAMYHGIAVIWDEDHDTRIISVLEQLHARGLLAPIMFIGERKGSLTVLLSPTAAGALGPHGLASYKAAIGESVTVDNDAWPTVIAVFPESTDALVGASTQDASLYLTTIAMQHKLGK